MGWLRNNANLLRDPVTPSLGDCPAQDPIIFSGTVRSNLDPIGRAGSDLDIWEALRRASLKDYVSGLEVPQLVNASARTLTP